MARPDISRIFQDLSSRYDRISVSTIKGLLKGKLKVAHSNVEFVNDKTTPPCIEEAETAFLTHNCAILTAFRGGYTLEENIQRNESLKCEMDRAGLVYRPVMGCYREADWEYANIEYCFFVTCAENQDEHTFFKNIYQLSEMKDQDSFLYKRAGINKTAFLIATNSNARAQFKGDIRFAGQLFLRVPDVDAWTDCSNGRIAFQLKGMVMIGTDCKKVKMGEGNLFDAEGYNADAVVVIRRESEEELKQQCESYNSTDAPLFQHVFRKENQTAESIHDAVMRTMKKVRDQKSKRIGFHCSAQIEGSSAKAAEVAYNTIQAWAKRFNKKFEWIVIVDIYGDYSKILNDK